MNVLEEMADQAAREYMADNLLGLREVVEGMIETLEVDVEAAHDYRGLINQLRPLVKIYWCNWQNDVEITDEHDKPYTEAEMSEFLASMVDIIEYSDKYLL